MAALLVALLVAGDEIEATPATLAKANEDAQPGDRVILRGGIYGTPIRPSRSGAEGRVIVYRAAAGERPVFTELDLAIDLRDRSFVTIEGVTVEKVGRFLWAERSSRITVARCTFDGSSVWESCRLKRMGDHLRIAQNVFRNGTDLLSIQGGDHHLVEGNTFDTADHACLVLMGVQRSVVRGNRLTNPRQKLMEVLSTRRKEWPDPERRSEHLLIEDNRFAIAAGQGGSAGIQYAGSRSILRRNVFWKCGMGMDWTGYKGDAPEAMHNRSNRFYNNVIAGCGDVGEDHAGMRFATAVPDFGDQVVVNNIICGNSCSRGRASRAAGTVQIALAWDAEPSHARFFANDIIAGEPGQRVFFWCDAKGEKNRTLREYETAYPDFAAGNIETQPLFVDADRGDFRLKSGSPCIDAGRALTTARKAGEGTGVDVDDPLFFCDGHGVVGADVIRVGAERVRVVAVDYEGRRLTADRAITWSAGTAVTLDFADRAPDMGCFETVSEGVK